MDDLRLKVNEELMDAQAARIDDLERRLEELTREGLPKRRQAP